MNVPALVVSEAGAITWTGVYSYHIEDQHIYKVIKAYEFLVVL